MTGRGESLGRLERRKGEERRGGRWREGEKQCSPVDEEEKIEPGTREIQDLFERLAGSLFRG